MLNICISGATGWTGQELVRGVIEAADLALASAVARRTAGRDIGEALGEEPAGVSVVATLAEALEAPCDVLIDYTHPSAGKAHALTAIGRGIPVADISALSGAGETVRLVMKDGAVFKDTL